MPTGAYYYIFRLISFDLLETKGRNLKCVWRNKLYHFKFIVDNCDHNSFSGDLISVKYERQRQYVLCMKLKDLLFEI